ncbi:MAG: conjugal transfer protein TraN [Pseudomonadota bacterium]
MSESVWFCREGMCCLAVCGFCLFVWLNAYPKWPAIAMVANAIAGAAVAFFLLFVAPASAQDMTRDEAQDEAENLAAELETMVQDGARQTVDAATVPGFVTKDPAETAHYGSPAGLESAGIAAMATSEESAFVTDSIASRPIVTSTELQTWTSNGLAVEADATSLVTEYGGTYGDCTTTITGGTATHYSYACNEGETLLEFTDACAIPLTVTIPTSHVHECRWIYLAGDLSWEPDLHCYVIQSEPSCGPMAQIAGGDCTSNVNGGVTCADQIWRAACDVEAIAGVGAVDTIPGTPEDNWDEAACNAKDADANCSFLAETCVEGAATRLINGVPVTRDCWRFERNYQCAALGGVVDDCDVPPDCALDESVCLSTDDAGGECRTWEHTYSCTASGSSGGAVGYCEEDVYCIDGDCETLTRPQNDEFHQAVSALEMLGQLEADGDPDTLEVFPGAYAKCDKVVAGLQNCCANDGFLTAIGFGCSADDKALADKQSAGLCHYVGTYCSNRTLFGICLKKRKTFCCFNNKLARIVHEQGRPQVGWEWGEVKSPDCSGFTVTLFQMLDLSVMDFSEFYNDVLDGFVPPDGDAAAAAIISNITSAYACPPSC